MKIYTDKFRRYAKVLHSITEKGNIRFESIYFNFKDSYVYLFSSKSQARMIFLWEKTNEDEVVENFSVSLEYFLPLIFSYEYLEVNNKIFSYKNEEFDIQSFVDEDIDLSLYDKIKDIKTIEINTNQVFLNHFLKCMNYIERDESSENASVAGIFLRKNVLLGTDKFKFYNGTFDFKVEEDINFSLDLSKIINNLADKNKVCIGKEEKFIYVNVNNDIDILSAINLKLDIPDIFSEKFVNLYNHETFFVVEKEKLLEVINFLGFYTKDVPNNRVQIEIGEKLDIKVIDKNKIKRQIDIIEKSEVLNGSIFQISNIWLKLAVNDIENKYIKFQVTEDNFIINITGYDIVNNENKVSDRHIMIGKLKI